MKLYIEIELERDAMQTANDAVNAITRGVLKQASSMFNPLRLHECGALRDKHGNTVGQWEVV